MELVISAMVCTDKCRNQLPAAAITNHTPMRLTLAPAPQQVTLRQLTCMDIYLVLHACCFSCPATMRARHQRRMRLIHNQQEAVLGTQGHQTLQHNQTQQV
jgi:hypothetical protein